jgi:zinc transporter ZupT
MTQPDILIVLFLAVISPIIGSVIGVLKQPSEKFMYVMLAFAGGVMLSISFLQLIPESLRLSSVLICVAGVTTGVIIMFALDKLIPHIHPELCTPEHGNNLKLTAAMGSFPLTKRNQKFYNRQFNFDYLVKSQNWDGKVKSSICKARKT